MRSRATESGEREAAIGPSPLASPTEQRPGYVAMLDERLRGTKFVELAVRSVINSPESTGMGFWSLNPYVGCEFGCSYCYARYAHRYVVERAWNAGRISLREFHDLGAPVGLEPFEHRVFVKSRDAALRALDRDLARVRRRTADEGRQNIVIGTATDPYQPAERQYQITRAVLQRLLDERGFRLGVITKSPLITRDIPLLVRLARKHRLSVYVSLISVDLRHIKRFEARSPMPHARLRALERLVAAGVRAGLIVAPVLPGITDSPTEIEAIVRAAKAAGASFVFPSPLRLYPAVRERFLPLVQEQQAELAERYRAAYAEGWDAPGEYVRALKRRFQRVAAAHGIVTTDGDREQPSERAVGTAQLSLWGM
jgi:DNA repair photolyase